MPRVVITADGGFRRGAASEVEVERGPGPRAAVRRCAPSSWCAGPDKTSLAEGRDQSGGTRWSTDRARRTRPEAFDAEQPLYIMYTSGTTAKPKGILHTTGGYLTHVSTTHRLVFDLKPEKTCFGRRLTSAG